MSTPPVPPGRPEDLDDPTGVRALLAGLSDPGPMPADLVDRINASIAAEQRARSAGRASAAPRDTVVPLRRRLPSWPKVGLAAAAVAVVAVAVPAMSGTGPGELLASLSGTGTNSADSAAGSAAKASPEAGRKDAGQRAMSSAAAVTLQATGTAYTSSALRTQVRTVLGGAVEDHASTPSSAFGRSSAGAASADEAGLRECLTALGVAASVPLTGDVATYDGRPAVVVVVSGDTGKSVYAVAPDCDADHPALMVGPVPLG